MFKDIFAFDEKGNKYFTYRSGKTVYEECLENGKLVTDGWNGAGFELNVLDSCPRRLDSRRFTLPFAFSLEVNGFSLNEKWKYVDFTQEKSINENGCEIIVSTLALENENQPVKVYVKTLIDSTAVLTRWLEVENAGDKSIALGSVSPIAGGLEFTENVPFTIPGKTAEDIYDIGYFEYSQWGHEGAYRRHKLPAAGYSVCGRYMTDRYRHPMFTLENKITGVIYIAQLAFTGGYAFDFYLDNRDGNAALSYKMRIDGPNPLTVLNPGEKYETPKCHIGMLYGSLDDAVNEMHSHMRKSVFLLPDPDDICGYVESGMGPERDMTVEYSKHYIDTAAMVGAETFIIDAGWYCPPGKECEEWGSRTGDWYPDKERYKNGIEEVRDYAEGRGLKFGLWMDLETFGHKSEVFKNHPDWVLKTPDGNPTIVADMTNPEVAAFVEGELVRVIEEYKIKLFRLDNNRSFADTFFCGQKEESGECSQAKYFKAVYEMYDRVHRKYPDVIFENCAGGGGRTDLGLMPSFTHTWVSDWQIAPRSVLITNGMTMALPPEKVDRLISGMESHKIASLPFIARHAIFGRPTVNDFNTINTAFNPEQIDFVKHTFDIYKNIIRPFAKNGKIYHHTPEIYGENPTGDCVLERSAEDKSTSVIGIFRLFGTPEDKYVTVYPKGIDASRTYEVTFDNEGAKATVSGYSLKNEGIKVYLPTALTSELVIIESK